MHDSGFKSLTENGLRCFGVVMGARASLHLGNDEDSSSVIGALAWEAVPAEFHSTLLLCLPHTHEGMRQTLSMTHDTSDHRAADGSSEYDKRSFDGQSSGIGSIQSQRVLYCPITWIDQVKGII